ncbi:prenyltransferase [Aeromicrobium sp. A1-2]|uniref:prenyltransferase/squalene oxidase repeat-containing protein n=1 Tax=Aeromicrobium sp. A1-2 TaxID=2107713 RepID=UPI000E504867|nr:prenyltransferase/squalene oxidase repeat-containing protein [Aeromicrobium sp. A1-2]AXT85520.1 prenyltransferase [Aeromicrobium sp. A1-2]
MPKIPSVPGVLTQAQVRQTADSIVATQLPSGAIPWFTGGHTDPWDHVQAAMALSAADRPHEAARAYGWLRDVQRPDGSWAIRYVGEIVEDPHTDSNFCAYLATGVWHHWRATGDRDFVELMWPTVARAIDLVLGMQRPDGAVVWARTETGPEDEALVTGNASIHLSLRCAIALAELLDDPQPAWELSAGRLRHALDDHPELFNPKPTHSMDWYYPLLGGAMAPERAAQRIDERWDDFVVDGLGARCVSTNPWVTGGETCELALALDALGRTDEARTQLAAMQHLRDDDGSYWTGLVYDIQTRWPVERTTWTAATVILAADALSRTTPANGVFRGEGLPLFDWKASDSCPCPSPL